MGAWGAGHFQNDGAGDFVGDLADDPDWNTVNAVLSTVANATADQFLEARECEAALAAAAVIAHLRGTMLTSSYPEYFQSVAALGAPSLGILAIAIEAVARVRANSELRDLWDESGSLAGWLNQVDQLTAALA